MARLATLNSWKEIADYLERSVRTVQRWESRFGLPVRHRSGKRTAVFAIEAELNSWLQTQSRFRLPIHEVPQTYERVFHRIPLPMALANDVRDCIDANAALCELLGRSKEELKGRRLDQLSIENERGSLASAWEMMLSRGTVSNSLLFSTRNSASRWLEFQGVASVAPGLHLVILTPSRELANLIAGQHHGTTGDDSYE